MAQGDWIGASKWELDTPCLVIDEEVLEENIRAMQGHAALFGKQLRPHVKTHKCSHLAKMQIETGCAGLCVAKVSEAEALVKNGIQGSLITSPVVTGFKIERLMDCLTEDPGLMVVIGDSTNARELDAAAGKRVLKLNVLVDLDPGSGRTGVSFKDGLSLGQLIETLPSLRLCGVQCYAGQVQHIEAVNGRAWKAMTGPSGQSKEYERCLYEERRLLRRQVVRLARAGRDF